LQTPGIYRERDHDLLKKIKGKKNKAKNENQERNLKITLKTK